MPRRLTRSAPGGGGTARMRLSAASETTNVATSTPKVTGSPTVAMSTPATGGPSTWPRLPRRPSSADAAVSRSAGTMRGTSASSDGRCRESVAAAAATADEQQPELRVRQRRVDEEERR